MRYLIFIYLISSAFQVSAQTESSWWMGMKMGRSHSKVSDLRIWAIGEGVDDVPGFTSNTLFGFDIAYQRGQIPFQFCAAFDLPRTSQSAPYTFSFMFHSGYEWLQHPRTEIKTLAGLGFGYSIIRFRNNTPASLQALPYNHADAFARSGLLLYQTTLQVTHTLKRENVKSIRPKLIGEVAFLGKLNQSNYWYGVNEQDVDGYNMVGEKTNIPKFYKGSVLLSIGIWFCLTCKKTEV